MVQHLYRFLPANDGCALLLDVASQEILASNSSTLYDNFETFGQVWMVLHSGLGQGQIGTWELHTNGLTGPSASGTVLLEGYNPLAISYDPASQTVQGSINGVLTPALSYTPTGITDVGFEGAGSLCRAAQEIRHVFRFLRQLLGREGNFD